MSAPMNSRLPLAWTRIESERQVGKTPAPLDGLAVDESVLVAMRFARAWVKAEIACGFALRESQLRPGVLTRTGQPKRARPLE